MKISLIGAGKAAKFISKRLELCQLQIHELYNRTLSNAQILGDLLECKYTNDIGTLDTNIDVLIFAINDDAILDISSKLKLKNNTLLISLSGTLNTNKLPLPNNWSTLWPVYSMNQNSYLQDNIPIATTPPKLNILQDNFSNIVSRISTNIYELKDEQRGYAHICAVMANNFVNFINTQMFILMEKENLEIKLIEPIMQQTLFNNLHQMSNSTMTGPAVRGDNNIIQKHLSMLTEYPSIQNLYQQISQAIINSKNNDQNTF